MRLRKKRFDRMPGAHWHPGRTLIGKCRFCLVLAAPGLMVMAGTARASTQVYTPIDPAFGGSPFNSSYLLGVAGAINPYQPPTNNTIDQGALFLQELQGQLLGALSTQITNIIFGPNAAQSGQVVFGDQTIAFVRGTGSVDLTISNATTGAVTHISIPTLLTSSTTGSSSTSGGTGG